MAENRLFSTLDTFLRRVFLPSGKNILLSDTVGFIRDLPPGLVTAFRTTLEEITASDFLLVILDAAAPDLLEVRSVVEETLEEIGAGKIPRLFVLNKSDLLPPGGAAALEERFRAAGEAAVSVSALKETGINELLSLMDGFVQKSKDNDLERAGEL